MGVHHLRRRGRDHLRGLAVGALTLVGAVLTGASVALCAVAHRATPDTRAQFLATWWAVVCVWFGIVFMLTGALL